MIGILCRIFTFYQILFIINYAAERDVDKFLTFGGIIS